MRSGVFFSVNGGDFDVMLPMIDDMEFDVEWKNERQYDGEME